MTLSSLTARRVTVGETRRKAGAAMRAEAAGNVDDGAEPARVLVVDDEESITQLVSTVLRYEGFAVETAGDGRAAVKSARTFRPDLVVLDVMLPDLDGFEVYRRIEGDSARMPVLFLTARDSTEDR